MRLVQDKLENVLEGFDLGLKDDSEVAEAVAEAVRAFEGFEHPTWFEWSSKHLMVQQKKEHEMRSQLEEARLRHEVEKVRRQQLASERTRVESSQVTQDIEMSQGTLVLESGNESRPVLLGREDIEQGIVDAHLELLKKVKMALVAELRQKLIKPPEFQHRFSELEDKYCCSTVDKGKAVARTPLFLSSENSGDEGKSQSEDGKRKRSPSPDDEVVCDWCANFAAPSLKCIILEDSPDCVKCQYDRKRCIWSGKS